MSELETLVSELEAADASIKVHNKKKEEIKKKIIGLVGNDKKEGGKTVSPTDSLSITVTNGVNRKLDLEKLETLNAQLPQDLQILKTKRELDLSNYRTVYKTAGDEFKKALDGAITETPKKASLSFKRKES